MKVGIILTTDNRSKAYIQKLIKNNIILDEIILMNSGNHEVKYSKEIIQKSLESGFDISISVLRTLKENNLKFHEFNFVDINNLNSNLDAFVDKNVDIYDVEIEVDNNCRQKYRHIDVDYNIGVDANVDNQL